jgi:hypothetical protein
MRKIHSLQLFQSTLQAVFADNSEKGEYRKKESEPARSQTGRFFGSQVQ